MQFYSLLRRFKGRWKFDNTQSKVSPELTLIYSAEYELVAKVFQKIFSRFYTIRCLAKRPPGYGLFVWKFLQIMHIVSKDYREPPWGKEEQLYLDNLNRLLSDLSPDSIRNRLDRISHIFLGVKPNGILLDSSSALVIANIDSENSIHNLLSVIGNNFPSTSLKLLRLQAGHYTQNAPEYCFPTRSNYMQQKLLSNLAAVRLFEVYFRYYDYIPQDSFFSFSRLPEKRFKFSNLLLHFISKLFLRMKKFSETKRTWHVAFLNLSLEQNPDQILKVIPNPKNRSFADPFVVELDNKVYIFVEDIDLATSKGSISVIILDPDSYEIEILKCIEEEYHLSYPFIFQYENEWYMCPESGEANRIVLYKCIQFPYSWEFFKVLVNNISAVDVNIFEHNSIWNMTFSHSPLGRIGRSCELHWLTASSPNSDEWMRADGRPVITNSQMSRNGGLLMSATSKLYVVRQLHGFEQYGTGMRIIEIQSDESKYQHILRANIQVVGQRGVLLSHHYSQSKSFIVVDVQLPRNVLINDENLRVETRLR